MDRTDACAIAMWIKWHLGPLTRWPVIGYFLTPVWRWSVDLIDDMHRDFDIANGKGPVYLLSSNER